MRVTVCPDCEEPIGSVERYCWNCGVPVDRPALVLLPDPQAMTPTIGHAKDRATMAGRRRAR